MLQKFLPEIIKGDIRILLIDQKPIGHFKRIPAKNDFRSNLIIGGKAKTYLLNKRDIEICKRIKPILKKNKLFFVGIDIIGNFLTEINTTSPTGIASLNKIKGQKIEKQIWDIIEQKYNLIKPK